MPHQIQAQRTRAVIIHELEQARGHRDFAARTLATDSYREFVEEIDTLLSELFAMRAVE